MTYQVLDMCCGSRMMWFDRDSRNVVFGDIRRETVTVADRSHGKAEGLRLVSIQPLVVLDFRALPFADSSFNLVVFDPPHLERAGPRSWMAAKYGKLSKDWRSDLSKGFREGLRVLRVGGTLIFKWSESQIPVGEAASLAPIAPLFGSGRSGKAHWLVFLKGVDGG